jgi:hypothetical protein
MAASYGKFSHLDAIALRISRLDSAGTPVYGSVSGAYLLCCEGRMTTTPTTEDGQLITKGGYCAGKTCNSWETPDRISGYDGELTICNVADEILELIGVGVALSASVAIGGAAAAAVVGTLYYETGGCADVTVANGVTLEMWSRPILCKSQVYGGNPLTTLAWRKKVIPWAYNFVPTAAQDPTGDAFPDYIFQFKLRPPGAAWADGAFNDNPFLQTSQNALAPAQTWTYAEYWTTVAPPTCAAGISNYTTTPAAVP